MLRILFLPLFSSILCGGFGRFLGHPGSMILSSSFMAYTCYLACEAFFEIALGGQVKYLRLAPWIESGLFECDWSFVFDTLTVVMLVVITSISTLVHLYSTGYMKEDPHVPRFMSYLSLFTFFMILLVTGDNFMVMFVGWEGVGLCSYLLINFWFTRLQANKAALKAMIMNRIGDFGLAIGIFSAFYSFRAIDYDVIFSLVNYVHGQHFFFIYDEFPVIDTICLFLFIGAMGKSAQLGLHLWLPDAMEGPTPVSALIHAATMVTAGVFLITRCSPLFEYSPMALNIVTVIGASTAFFASTVALVQNDIKKVIAYSTCSQLGYMMFSCGVSNYAAGMFHLTNHAFFKALLFLSAGSVIHAMGDEQDMRRMGGLRTLLPYTYSMFLIGNLALIGFPFLSGFYSKDMILESAYATYSFSGWFAYVLGTIAAFFTSFYSTRLLYLVFLTEPNGYKKIMEHVHEAPFVMAFPLGLLALLSLFSGYSLKDMFVGFGTDFWGNSIFVHPKHLVLMDAEFISDGPKQWILMCSIYGALISYYLYSFFFAILYDWKMSSLGLSLYNFLNRKWFFDKLMNDFLSQRVMRVSYMTTYRILDKGYFELFGPMGISHVLYYYMEKVAKLSTGFIYHSSFIILLGATMLTVLLLLPSVYVNLKISLMLFFGLMLQNYTRHIVDFPEEEIPWEKRRPHYGEDWYYF
jgi:proton-translocating NADH-quinone oxidoreductase chain L